MKKFLFYQQFCVRTFKQLDLTRKVLKMALKLLFAVVCLAAVQAKNIESYENIDIVAVGKGLMPHTVISITCT